MLTSYEKLELLHKEFLFEHSRADIYIERNYKILVAWMTALTALITLGMEKDLFDTAQSIFVVFAVILPSVNYVCAVFYAFNSYANMLCGQRAEVIHRVLFSDSLINSYNTTYIQGEKVRSDFLSDLPKYILSNAFVSAPTYIILVLVFFGSSVFGYYYALHNCGSKYKNMVWFSIRIMIALVVVTGLLYSVPLIISAVKRMIVKKERTLVSYSMAPKANKSIVRDSKKK